MRLSRIHHVAIIASDYERSKSFYTETLGLRVVAETYREARRSHKLDLALPDGASLNYFPFPARRRVRPGRKPAGCGISPLRWPTSRNVSANWKPMA